MKSEEIYREIKKNVLNGAKVPHGISQPVIYYEDGKYYIAVFLFYYTKEDINSGMISRPSFWAIMNIDTGEIVERRWTNQSDFSDASYDIKYNVRSDDNYDTSRKYYERAFTILDAVREKIIEDGTLLKEEYQSYLNMVLKNIPREYQRFYRDLSIRCDDNTIN